MKVCRKTNQAEGKEDHLIVQDGKYSFEYDYVYGDDTINGRNPRKMYSDCVDPLVEGLFGGYSATVLAYGQTGSGKTYTMGGLDTSFVSSSSSSSPSFSSPASDGSVETPSPGVKEGERRAHRGIIPRAVDSLYAKLDKETNGEKGKEVKIKVSYVEIYNEEIRDLLVASDGRGEGGVRDESKATEVTESAPPLQRKGSLTSASSLGKQQLQEIQIRESSDGCVHLVGCSEVEVRSKKHMCVLFQKGLKLRSTSKTGMNKQSSRSHAIFAISVESRVTKKTTDEATGEEKVDVELLRAKINLVDLAGSERVKRTHAEGSTFREGVNINKGLLALGNVISALASESPTAAGMGDSALANDAGSGGEQNSHVPYRDSKLTRILRDALGGNSKTVMIACVSPCTLDCDESVNTLRYAQRARSITNVVTKDALDALQGDNIEALREALNRTKAENALLKKQLCLCRSEVSTLKSIIKFGTHKTATRALPAEPQLAWSEPTLPSQEAEDKGETGMDGGGGSHPPALLNPDVVSGEKHGAGARERLEAEEAQSLKVLESHVSKLDEALLEKELAMEKVRKGVNEMHQQIVETCVTSKSQYTTVSAGEQQVGSCGPAEKAHVPEDEMKQLVSSMESEIGELQTQKLELLQQLQEYANTSEAALQEQVNATSIRSKSRKGKKDSKKGAKKPIDPKEARQKQMLMDKVKRLESVLSELKQKHAKLVNLERLKKKSDALCDRLKKDVEEIKRQKCQLMKEINGKAKRFASYQKVTKKEMQSLQREKAKADQARSKLEINKEKQLQALKRKTEECNKHKNKLKQLTRKDSRGASDGVKSKHGGKEGEDVPELQPNALAPLLRDERSRQIWIEEEMEACTLLEKLRDSLKETHADTLECSQCIKSLKNKSRALERKIDKCKRKSSTGSEENGAGSQSFHPHLESWEAELQELQTQLSSMELSRKQLDERMASLEMELSHLMYEKAACFMLTAHNKEDMNHDDHQAAFQQARVNSRDAHRFAKLLINGKNGMNANGMSSDLRRWSGLRSLAEARGMLRIVFSKAIKSRIDSIKAKKALESMELETSSKQFDFTANEDHVKDEEHVKPEPADVPADEIEVPKRSKKHSYVDPKWVDDILTEQAKILKELADEEIQEEKQEEKQESKSKSSLARLALLKYSENKDIRAEAISPKALSPTRKFGWMETKQVITNVLQARNV
ncbi:kinesin [Chloropicon primus]|uniref:Kinesin n=1 Tax=Chloropicon primus TaxID=1764295 RepID=A0A5B8N0Q1_9CHLO|nr:kinesin [Chloropicon primus]|eukprot:QDZ25826.1 kinesin [Chloropicon primus]